MTAIEVGANDDKKNTFVFYQIEHKQQTLKTDYKNDLSKWILDRVHGASEEVENYPVYHLYGRTYDGRSILCVVHGFYTYFYVKVKDEYANAFDDDDKRTLSDICAEVRRVGGGAKCVRAITFEKRIDANGFHLHPSLFARVELHYDYKENVRRVSDRFRAQKDGMRYLCGEYLYQTDADAVVQFLADRDWPACSWLEFNPSRTLYPQPLEKEVKYGRDQNSVRDTRPNRKSRCDVEIHCHYEDLVCRSDILDTGKAISLSLDIEVINFRGEFNDGYDYLIGSISLYLTREGEADALDERVLTVGNSVYPRASRSPSKGHRVLSYASEKDMLMALYDYIVSKDPDVVEGYNIYNYDLDYIYGRAKHLGMPDAFYYMGRLRYTGVFDVRDSMFKSKNSGTIETKKTSMSGRVMFDVLPAVKSVKKLRSYKLDAVAYECLKENKEDVEYSEIPFLWSAEGEDAAQLHSYCMQDSRLARRLNRRLMFFVNYVEMSRVAYVPLTYLLEKGQCVKIIAQLYALAKKEGFAVHSEGSANYDEDANESRKKGFEGATVIPPKRGFYEVPVPTLDFSSLYPSIMIAHNLCYSTYLQTEKDVDDAKEAGLRIETSPIGHSFVHRSERQGLLPKLVENLLKKRAAIRARMEQVDPKVNPILHGVLNAAQLAVKLSANSIYGFTGAAKLPAVYVSASVTSYGRQGIMLTKEKIEAKWPGVEVIYGDTDSVMVAIHQARDWPMAKVIEMSKEMAHYVNQFFEDPMRIEFEKVFQPYLLLQKKNYAGLHWERPDKPKMLNIKGLEPVRRDNAPIVAETVQETLDILMYKRDINAAARHVVEKLHTVRMGKVAIDKLIISKNYSKSKERYAAPQPHITVIEKMSARNPGSEPTIGSRVPYVMIESLHKKTCDRVEDPEYAARNPDKVKIDYNYYYTHMVTSLSRVLGSIFGQDNMQRLFTHDADSINRYTVDMSKIGDTCQVQFEHEEDDDEEEDSLATEESPPSDVHITSSSSSSSSSNSQSIKKRNLDGLGDDIVSRGNSKRAKTPTTPPPTTTSTNKPLKQTSMNTFWR